MLQARLGGRTIAFVVSLTLSCIVIKFVATFVFAVIAFAAQATEPSAASIDRLLDITQSRRTVDAIQKQVEAMMKPMFEQALDSKSLSPEKREEAERYMASFSEKMKPVFAEMLDWQRLKELTAKIYMESFSQEEIDGLIAFYESATGKAFVERMPLVMQKSMVAMQQRMVPLMEKMKQAAKESAAEFKAQ